MKQGRSGKEEIKAKRRALCWVRKRLATLQEENERLAYQHQLVAELCKGFEWFRDMQLHAVLADPELMLADDASADQQLAQNSMQQLTSLLEIEGEVQLLQQLSVLPVNQSNTSKGSAAPPAPAPNSSYSESMRAAAGTRRSNRAPPASSCQLVAPPDDAMWLLKLTYRQPWPHDCPSAGDMTAPELIKHYMAIARTLSLQLVQFDACKGAAEQAEPLRKLQGTLLQHFRVLLELCGCRDRTHLLRAMQLAYGEPAAPTF
uniref:Uncharacterized protein n=1 Tax=Tetradesmus obliquus TaxID=3088 RepID=A0A383W898_TETOB|eukprot:jgi/Sobl393_1/4903/SZX73865.1